jgi:hypothetical protein
MANLISTVVNGTLNSTGRITASYDTDRYQMNFFRASASNWWVTNDSDKLGLHLNNVGDKFYFSTDGDFWSSTNGWLSTALAGKSNVGHTHDDRYYTETESDGRFQPLENQRLSTGNSVTFTNVYNNSWFRNNNVNEGLYNQATGTHFYSNGGSDWSITGSGSNIYLALRSNHQSTIRGYVHASTDNYIGFLSEDGNWVLRTFNRGVEAYGSMRAPIFYDSQDTTYYLDPNSTTALRTVGSWRSDSAAWDGEFAGKIQYHSNNWYFQASSYWYFRNSGGSNVVSIDSSGNITANGFVGNNSAQTRDKLRVWDSNQYTIGMKNGYDYGHLGNDEYAMSFQMNDDSGRGFWWGDTAHSDDQGAASLTTDGRMTIARSLSVGEGEAVTLPSSTPLYVKGSTSGADVIGVDGINGRLFTVTDDLSNSLFSVNTIAGLPVIEAFADNTVNIGKYGYATTWSTTGFVTMPNSANIYRDLFINGGRGGDFGNRLIIGTDATTYTMQDNNQRPTAYLHGAYPVLTLNHTVTSNGSHGPTIQFTHNTADKQWVIGTNGTGTRLDIGYSENTNRNPHNGIDDNSGSTFLRVDNGGNIQLGRGNGRSTWVNDTLYVGASDSGDSHMYFGEDSSGWYGLHWYWDSQYTVYLYGRNAGTDTEIMRYTTNSNTYVEWRRNFHMNNYEINYVSQLHFNAGTRFVGNNTNYLNFQTDSTSVGGIQVRDGNSTIRGYAGYYDSDGFGLLNSSGNWGIKLNPGNVETLLYYAGAWRVQTKSGGVQINGNVYIDTDYGHGIVGLYSATRYQGVFAMGDSYKLLADGTGTGTLYGIAWTHTNVGGQSKTGLDHQALFMTNGVTQTAIGTGIWTNGLITTTSYGTSANWNTAFGWGNHASADYIVKGTQVLSAASWTTATRFGSVGNINQDAGNHALSVRSEDGNDAFMSFHVGNDYAVHFGLDRVSNRMHVGGWSDGAANKYQLWDSRDFTSTNVSNWNTAYGWGNHASAGYQAAATAITTSNIGSQSVSYATSAGYSDYIAAQTNPVGNFNVGLTRPKGASYTTTASSVTGAIKIKLPPGVPVHGMWKMTVKIYEYGQRGNGYTIELGCHLYPSTAYNRYQWMLTTDTGAVLPIRYGTDGTSGCVWIGENGTTWSYPQIHVTEFSNGFNNPGGVDWNTGTWGVTIGAIDNSVAVDGPYTTSLIAASYATTAGSLTSMNISQFTNNSGYITGYTETDTLATVTGRGATTLTAITLSGGSGTTPTLALDRNIATPSNYYNGLQLEVRATSGTAGIGLHRNGYSHVGIYHDSANELKFNMNAGTPILPATAGTIWGSGNDGSGSGLDADLVDGYHVSVAGTANTIPTRNASGYLIPENWIQLNGIYGLYSPTNDAHLRPNNGSYGSWLVTGTRNGWRGLEFDSGSAGNVSLMVSSDSNTSGFHNNSYGWQIRWYNGTLYVGKNSYGGGDVAVIDANSIGSQSVAFATTANRLERYGVIYGNNWNDYYLNNRFIVASAHNATGTNKPDTAYNYGSMMSYYNSGEDHYQIYVTENSVNSNGKDRKMYYRSGWNGSWGGWRSVVDVYNSVCYIDGTVTATGDVIAYSDARVKENVHTIENALDKTLKLRGVTYNRTDVEDKSTKIGVIAQEIMEVLPEVVSEDETGMYGVSYGNLTAVLIEAIKEQQKQIEELRNELNKLKG